MCDCCSDLIELMLRYDREVNEIVPADEDPEIRQPLAKSDVEVIIQFFQLWQQRRCNCIFRDGRSVERLNNLIRGVLVTAVTHLKCIQRELSEGKPIAGNSSSSQPPLPDLPQQFNEQPHEESSQRPESADNQTSDKSLSVSGQSDQSSPSAGPPLRLGSDVLKHKPTDRSDKVHVDVDGSMDDSDEDEDDDEDEEDDDEDEDGGEEELISCDYDRWSLDEREKLLMLVSKIFYMHFPVYTIQKHNLHSPRLDDLSQKEAALLGSYCDLSDSEMPIMLLRNITFFCELDVMDHFCEIFNRATPDSLPLTLAHAIVAVIHHLKYGLNVSTLLPKLVSLRTVIIQYLCKVPDKDLRIPTNRNLFEFMWSSMKDPMETTTRTLVVDREGLALALKYFTSTTLTMRLTGISQINNYISIVSEYSQNDAGLDHKQIQVLQDELTDWILSNQIIDHIFGPNLHVEVIKQSHVVLNFVVSKITAEHVDAIWSAAQLKHCSKQVHDLLTQLVKKMEVKSVLHLYSLLRSVEARDHNEHTLHLISCILTFIWARSLNIPDPSGISPTKGLISAMAASLVKSPIFTLLPTRSNDDESSSASADNSDDEDEDDFDVELPVAPGSGKSVRSGLPNSPESSCWSPSSDEAEALPAVTGSPAKKSLNLDESGGSSAKNGEDSDMDDGLYQTAIPSPQKGRKKRPVDLDDVTDIKCKSPKLSGPLAHLKKAGDDLLPGIEDDSEMHCDDDSSRISQISQKRMSDFEGEDSPPAISEMDDSVKEDADEKEVPPLIGVAAFPVSDPLISPVSFRLRGKDVAAISLRTGSPSDSAAILRDPILSQFSIDNVCKPGQTLLWDLLQDGKITSLPDGLAKECEKILFALISGANDRRIRMKFIEGCLENLEKNSSVIVSLKLLPRILISFNQFRGNSGDIHAVTLWADNERHMLRHFFSNLILYCSRGGETESPEPPPPLPSSSSSSNPKLARQYPHSEEIQIRLQFLTFIFSTTGSPDSFRLNKDQVDILWTCIANDKLCRDDFFSWMLNQIRTRDQHSLSPELYRYILMEKLPLIRAENFTMLALEILQCLCLVFLNISASDEAIPVAIKLLWDIALTASNTDVSMAAIKYLNNYYFHARSDHQELAKEDEFIEGCMKYLKDSAAALKSDEEKHSTIIQRALLLLKTHLEVFRQRYSFHLRKMQLEGDVSVVAHRTKVPDRSSPQTIRIVCQPASIGEKTHFEMQFSDYLGELRAEIAHWWESLMKKCKVEGINMPAEGPLRLLSQGQELHHELDEKPLIELGFKDLQLVYLSVGANRSSRRPRESAPLASDPSGSILSPPAKNRIPAVLLLNKCYFEQLFDLTQQLGSMCGPTHIKAQLMSRRVWDIIQMLPTSPDLLSRLQGIANSSRTFEPDEVDKAQQSISLILNDLLSPTNPQKLLYCVQIVDWLRRTYSRKEGSWAQEFIDCGGLQHIFDIFISGILQQNDSEYMWNEWKQDCLAFLLQLIFTFGINVGKDSKMQELVGSSFMKDMSSMEAASFSKKKTRRKGMHGSMLVHTLNAPLLEMLKDVDSLLRALLTILNDATSRPADASCYQTGFLGRAQVIFHTINFLTSWAFSDPIVGSSLFKFSNFPNILKKLLLDDPDPGVRREACTGFYRMCLGYTITQKKGHGFIPPLLNALLSFISVAENMRSPNNSDSAAEMTFVEKEPYGPGCKDYFWLVCRLIDTLNANDKGTVDFDRLCETVTSAIVSREIRETRQSSAEDEGLKGLLSLMSVTFKHDPPFKFSDEGKKFLHEVFDSLFDFPTQTQRNLPKCKAPSTRSTAFDLLVELCKESEENYMALVTLLQEQHKSTSHPPYSWDFWPHDDCRSECGYVGLINLGATCYMASCLQHLFMLPEARRAVLSASVTKETKHEAILHELQRMFAFLQESERKSYNPRNFCKVYTMDHELLNTGEQKDMTEFFTDLISKFEEMTDDLKAMVKNLFGGTISNNVVSLDCPHISRTSEEFYTLRCKVADMRSLFDSLDDLTVKDTLEGDNMYTCSQCGKKVRAEKRACIKKLPRILCFNTMRYTFNMITMTKEKVNTHFSFPMSLDMNAYLEDNLIPGESEDEESDLGSTEYELIGVTVHTGTAEGGHYYSFIREREDGKGRDKWYMFNDAEVKFFDQQQLGAECFGGEMTSKTYDSVTDKFMDFSFEKTNSAYMLFYERVQDRPGSSGGLEVASTSELKTCPDLPQDLASWIWDDNTQLLRDKTIFEHNYFDHLYQVCGYVPTTLQSCKPAVQLATTKLTTSFLLETLIHSKEKPTLTQWIELLTKQFNANPAAGEWLLDHMAEDPHWPVQILLKSPNQMVRQLFQRLCVHVINQLRCNQKERYLNPLSDCKKDVGAEIEVLKHVGQFSCVTRFIKKLLTLIKFNNLVKPHPKHLTEFFALLCEFARMGEEECRFLLVIEAISTVVQFYLNHCKGGSDFVDMMSDDDDDDDEEVTQASAYPGFRGSHVHHLSLDEKTLKPASLNNMVTFVAYLLEHSRGPDDRLHLSSNDSEVVFNGKGFPFIQRQIRDNINLRQTLNIIVSFCRSNEQGANLIVNMLLSSINRQPESSSPFFRILSMLVDQTIDTPGLPNFSAIIYPRIWEVAEHTPQHSLEWLTMQVTRNKSAHALVLNGLETWVDYFLISHTNQRVRNAAALLLVALVPNSSFRQSYNKAPRLVLVHQQNSMDLNTEAVAVIQRIFTVLLNLLKSAKEHADPTTCGTAKLVSYFAVMSYCLITKTEKQMLVPYFMDLWNLFQPKLSEPPVSVNQNKQALLWFWYQACTECPENVKCIVQNPTVVKNIAFNYILADHDDQEVIMFNRNMLPSYYGLLRLCCLQSRSFTRQLANHQNIQWAFKNITPFTSQYQAAASELFKLMKLFIQEHPDSTETELKEIRLFKRTTLHMYLTNVDSRSNWSALISALNTLVENEEDKAFVIATNGIICLLQSFNTLFMMFHEATACHITSEIVDVLKLVTDLLITAKTSSAPEIREWIGKWKEHHEIIRKLIHLLNTYTPNVVRSACMSVLLELIEVYPKECVPILVQGLGLGHLAFQDQFVNFSAGPYFPRRGQRVLQTKSSLRPPKAVFQMHFHPKMLEVKLGTDPEYDQAVIEYFRGYFSFVESICRVAIQNHLVNQELVGLCSMVALESLPMGISTFILFWKQLAELPDSGHESEKEFINLLCTKCTNFREYILSVLNQERRFLCQDLVFDFFVNLATKVKSMQLNPQLKTLSSSLISEIIRHDASLHGNRDSHSLLSTQRALYLTLLYDVRVDAPACGELTTCLTGLRNRLSASASRKEERSSPDDLESVTPQKKRKTDGDSEGEECIRITTPPPQASTSGCSDPPSPGIELITTDDEQRPSPATSSSDSMSSSSQSDDRNDKILTCINSILQLLE